MLLIPIKKQNGCFTISSKNDISYKYITLNEGDTYTFDETYHLYHLLFVLNNKSVRIYKQHKSYIKHNSIFLVSNEESLHIEATSKTSLIIHSFNDIVNICDQDLYDEFPKNISKKRIIKIKEPLQHYLDSLITYIDDKSLCSHLELLKHKELFLILRKYYSRQEYSYLLNSIMDNDSTFKKTIRDNYMKIKNIEELAALCNKSLSTFIRLFKKNFNDNPHSWIKKQKLNQLRKYILDVNKPFVEIIDELNFSSFSYFSQYCRTHFGKSPKEMRKTHFDKKMTNNDNVLK